MATVEEQLSLLQSQVTECVEQIKLIQGEVQTNLAQGSEAIAKLNSQIAAWATQQATQQTTIAAIQEKIMTPQGETRNMNFKRAEKLMPEVWDNSKGECSFENFKYSIAVYISALDTSINSSDLLNSIAKLTRDPDDDIINSMRSEYPNIWEINRELADMLCKCTKGEAKTIVRQVGIKQGLRAWYRLTSHFSPRSATDSSIQLTKIMNRSRCKDAQELKVEMIKLESDINEYQAKFRMLEEDSKIVALKSIIPDTVFEHQFKGKTFHGFQDMRQELTNYLMDKQITASGKRNNDVSMVDDHADEDKDTDKENGVEKKITELMAVIENMNKGMNKGRGKGGWEAKGTGGKGWYAQGGDKGKGKGKSQSQKGCWTCGGSGHFQRECPSKGKGKGYGKSKGINMFDDDSAPWEGGEQVEWGDYVTFLGDQPQQHQIAVSNRFDILSHMNDCDEDHEYYEEEFPSAATSSNQPRHIMKQKMKKVKNRNWKKIYDNDMFVNGKFMNDEMMMEPPGIEKNYKMVNKETGIEGEQSMGCIMDDCFKEELFALGEYEVKQDRRGGWKKHIAIVDSGSVDSVANPSEFPQFEITESARSREGRGYRSATGQEIPNQGEQVIRLTTSEGQKKSMKLQIAPVKRTLLSVARMEEAGNDVYLTARDPRIVNRRTGESTRLKKLGGLYVLEFWVWTDFSRQGR